MVAVAQQVAQGLLQLFLRVRQRHTDGAAAVDDLHGTGHRQFLRQPGDIALGIVDVVPRSRANTERVHHPLRHGFIHGHAAAQIPGSGVGHAQQIQRGLYAAVLAAASVQRQKYHVRHAAHGQHVLAQQAGALGPSGCGAPPPGPAPRAPPGSGRTGRPARQRYPPTRPRSPPTPKTYPPEWPCVPSPAAPCTRRCRWSAPPGALWTVRPPIPRSS